MASIRIRPGIFHDFSIFVQWARAELQWELAPSDYSIYEKSLSPGWFWAAENNQQDLLGVICATEHGPDDGYIGCFYVRKDQRGSGVGKSLFEKAMSVLQGKNIALMSEPYNLSRYQKAGFTVVPNYHSAVGEGYTTKDIISKNHKLPGIILDKPSQTTINSIIEYDTVVAGRNRSSWVTQHLLHNPYSTSLIAFNAENRICGYGTAKDLQDGRLKFGPIYADTSDLARMIMFELLAKYTGDPDAFKLSMFCMWREDKADQCMANAFGVATPFPMTHLFTKRVPEFDVSKVYCIADNDINLV